MRAEEGLHHNMAKIQGCDPGMIDGVFWNKSMLEEKQSALIEFSKKNDIPVLLGEFSCPRWTGSMGNEYLEDIINIAEEYNWSWTYHSYRESHIWDPEMSDSDRDDRKRFPSTSRMKMLISYFKLNDQ